MWSTSKRSIAVFAPYVQFVFGAFNDQLLGAPWLYKGYVGAWQWGKAATENGKLSLYFVVGVITYVFCAQDNFAGSVAAFLNKKNSVVMRTVFCMAAVKGVYTMLTCAPGAQLEFTE